MTINTATAKANHHVEYNKNIACILPPNTITNWLNYQKAYLYIYLPNIYYLLPLFRCFTTFYCYGPGPPRAGRTVEAQAMCSALETRVVLQSPDCRWIWLPGLPSALVWEHSLLAESGSSLGAVAKLNCFRIGTSVSRCSTILQSSLLAFPFPPILASISH